MEKYQPFCDLQLKNFFSWMTTNLRLENQLDSTQNSSYFSLSIFVTETAQLMVERSELTV